LGLGIWDLPWTAGWLAGLDLRGGVGLVWEGGAGWIERESKRSRKREKEMRGGNY